MLLLLLIERRGVHAPHLSSSESISIFLFPGPPGLFRRAKGAGKLRFARAHRPEWVTRSAHMTPVLSRCYAFVFVIGISYIRYFTRESVLQRNYDVTFFFWEKSQYPFLNALKGEWKLDYNKMT